MRPNQTFICAQQYNQRLVCDDPVKLQYVIYSFRTIRFKVAFLEDVNRLAFGCWRVTDTFAITCIRYALLHRSHCVRTMGTPVCLIRAV